MGKGEEAEALLSLPARPIWLVCTALHPQPSTAQILNLLFKNSALVLFYRKFTLPFRHRSRNLPLYSQVQ